MSWLKVGDELDRDRRFKRFRRGKDRLLFIGVFTMIGTWSAGELSDGIVPFDVPADYGITPAMVNRMIDAGLWHTAAEIGSCPSCRHTDPPARDHFVICEWWAHLEDRETVLRRRKLDADRKKLRRQREQERAEADLRALMSGADVPPDAALEPDPESAWESGVPARPGPTRPGPDVVTGGGRPHAGSGSASPPPRYRCKSHSALPADVEGPNCIGCKNVRLRAEADAAASADATRAAGIRRQREELAVAAAARREREELIVACGVCNERGLRPGPEVAGRVRKVLCEHPDIARRAG